LLHYFSNRIGNMNLNVKRLFARSMTGGIDLVGPPVPPSPRSARRRMMFVTLAGILAAVGAVAGTYYYAMRPVTLRIAVGPANSDVRVVQALRKPSSRRAARSACARCRQMAPWRAPALADGRPISPSSEAISTCQKCPGRGNAAQNVAVLWVPPAAKVKGKKARRRSRK
jgi:hypothetical protein